MLLGVVALAASGIQSSAAATLQATLDANWRGAYDILVTSKNTSSDLGGLLAPNALAAGTDAMDLDDVYRVRRVAGVEVAAPIGEVVIPALKYGQASVTIPKNTIGADAAAQAYRVTFTYTTDDGLGERYVYGDSMDMVVDESVEAGTNTDLADCLKRVTTLNGFVVDERYPEIVDYFCRQMDPSPKNGIYQKYTDSSSSALSGSDFTESTMTFPLERTPQSVTRVTLVDPVAERQLLGDAGDFLAPLEQIAPDADTKLDAMLAWAEASPDDPFATEFLADKKSDDAILAGSTPEYLDEMKQLYADNGKDYDEEMAGESPPNPYAPILVADVEPAPLTVTVKVESFGDVARAEEPENGAYVFPFALPAGLEDGDEGVSVGTVSAEVGTLINPFVTTPVALAWPGTDPVATSEVRDFNSLNFQVAGTATSSEFEPTEDGVDLNPTGYRAPTPETSGSWPGSLFALKKNGEDAGVEAAYAGMDQLAVQKSPIVAVPVGSFSPSDVSAAQPQLSYVPLGAYQSIGSTLADGTVLEPSVSGLGLVSPQTVAIASINSAATWAQEAPVNGIRVRVGGIDVYSGAAREKVVAVASAIRAKGYTATIVAGSSPTDTTVHVAGYAFGTDSADGVQTVGDLGDVTQQWSELGAASRADLAISTASISILGIALGSTAVLLGAVQFASIPRRRGQAAVMRELGFTSTRIGRWMAAEEIPGLLVVVLAGLVAAWLSGLTQVSLTISAIGVGVVVATSTIAVVLGSRSRVRGPSLTSRRVRGRTVPLFGARQSRIHWLTAATHFVAILIVALSAAALAMVFLQGRTDAGASLLSQFTLGQAAVPQVTLGLAGIASGVILAVLSRRVDLARRAQQWSVMRQMGWTSSELRLAQRVEAASIVVPAVLVGGIVASVASGALAASEPLILTAVALVAGALASTVVLFVGRKASSL